MYGLFLYCLDKSTKCGAYFRAQGRYLSCTRGTTAMEYSLIVGGIAVAIAAIVFTVGSDLTGLFAKIGALAASF